MTGAQPGGAQMITDSKGLPIILSLAGVLLVAWLFKRRPAPPPANLARLSLSPWQHLTVLAGGGMPQLAQQVPTEVVTLSARGVAVLFVAVADGVAFGYASYVLFGFDVAPAAAATVMWMI